MTTAVEVQDLTRIFGRHTALDAVSFEVEEGAIFGYLGLNGAGKSTTIKILSTLLPPTRGRARILGHDVQREPLDVRRLIGMVGDDGGESRPGWSAREFLDHFATLEGVDEARVEEALDLVRFEPKWRSRAMGSYSTGMRRRVEVARALLSRPRVLFLDEPTRGLDLPAKRQLWDLLRDLARVERTTIFLSSHEVNEILALCQDLAVLHAGRLKFLGRASALGSTPAEFEERLIALLEGRASAPPDALPLR